MHSSTLAKCWINQSVDYTLSSLWETQTLRQNDCWQCTFLQTKRYISYAAVLCVFMFNSEFHVVTAPVRLGHHKHGRKLSRRLVKNISFTNTKMR